MKAFVKKIVMACAFLPTLIHANINPKDSTKPTECLTIVGMAIDEYNNSIDSVEVRLYKQSTVVKKNIITTIDQEYKNFDFTLEVNQYYTVEVSKPGYVTRRIGFYTDLPSNVILKPLFYFEFDLVLFKEKKMDDYYLDFPIALIYFNKKSGTFETADKYTKYIKSKIKEAEKEAEKMARIKNEAQKEVIVRK